MYVLDVDWLIEVEEGFELFDLFGGDLWVGEDFDGVVGCDLD